jgi:hypothetical protein
MKRLYSVDESRVYLYGYSMGGTGAYTLSGHFPGRFAAAVVIAGRTDYYRWRNIKREETHPFKRWLIEQDNPLDLAENIIATPMLVYQATADSIIPPEQPAILERRIKAVGGTDFEVRTFHGDHWTGFDLLSSREPMAWLLSRRREPLRKQTLKTHTPKYGQGPLARVDVMDAWMSEARLTAEWNDGRLTVSSIGNVSAFAILDQADMSASRAWRENALRIEAGAETAFEPARESAEFPGIRFRRKGFEPSALAKTASLAGPVREVFCRPFVVIRGTQGEERQRRLASESADRFAAEWYDFAKGRPRICSDEEAMNAPERIEGLNWVLFGTPDTNSILRRISSKLPIVYSGHEATVGGRRVSLEGRGLVFCYPNPERPDTLVAVFSGHPYGEHMPINHKWDFIPDFLVFSPERDDDDTNKPIVAGYFDSNWRFSKNLTWWFDK